MNEERRYFRIGLFVFAGVALLVGAVVLLGGSTVFERPVIFETYFDESVQGLEVGSPVKLRGVSLGAVRSIGLVETLYNLDPNAPGYDPKMRLYVVVRMALLHPLDEERAARLGQSDLSDLRSMIRQGLRLRLAQQGITGTAYVEADFLDNEKSPPMRIPWQPDNIYVPSAPSTYKSIATAAERLYSRLEQLDVEQVVMDLDKLLVTANEAAGNIDLADLQTRLGGFIEELRATNKQLQSTLAETHVGATLDDARNVIARIDTAIGAIQRVVEGSGDDLATSLENLRVITEDLRDVTGTAREYPSLLLLGEPPNRVDHGAGR